MCGFSFGEFPVVVSESGRGRGVTSWMQSQLHGGNPAADETLAELVFEFSRVIDICTRQDEKGPSCFTLAAHLAA